MSNEELMYRKDGSVAWLTLNRPEQMNSLNSAIVERMAMLLPDIAADDSVRVLILTGTGPAFCAGADLKEVLGGKELPPGEPDLLDRMYDGISQPLRDFPKPTIAVLNGITMAGGLELALCCDIVLAAEEAQIGDAHVNFGVYPGGGGAALLPRVLPHNAAKYLLLTGKTLSAAEMKTHGLVNEVVPGSDLQQAAADLSPAHA